jgi:hypothetical protein
MFKKLIQCVDEPNLVTQGPPTGIHVDLLMDYNQANVCFLLNVVTMVPDDSYGSSHSKNQSCIMLSPEEFDALISELQGLRTLSRRRIE